MLKEFVDPKMSRRVGDNSELCFSFEVSVFFLGKFWQKFFLYRSAFKQNKCSLERKSDTKLANEFRHGSVAVAQVFSSVLMCEGKSFACRVSFSAAAVWCHP